MGYLKRKKRIKLKVNKELLRSFEALVDMKTSSFTYNKRDYFRLGVKTLSGRIPSKSLDKKYSAEDLFEEALIMFLDKNK